MIEYRVQFLDNKYGWMSLEAFLDKDRAHAFMLEFDKFNPEYESRIVPAYI